MCSLFDVLSELRAWLRWRMPASLPWHLLLQGQLHLLVPLAAAALLFCQLPASLCRPWQRPMSG